MNETRYLQAQRQAHMFKAMSHPLRMYILVTLKDRPRCVCELAEEMGVDKSVASKHLSQLREAGLIKDTKTGTQVEYRLAAPCVLEVATCSDTAVLMNRKSLLGI
ncbi:MAG: winged helix-turn-helix transcriptional regulator [Spirochaetales bacterium]|nr:winged helix-turn-helix transcriptional regulator [Spirochaetales bacterium]